MSVFALTYDLNNKKDYETLIGEIESHDSVKSAESFYFISLGNTTSEVRDHFTRFIDDDDTLVVAKVSDRPRCHKPLKGTNAWLEKHF